MCLKMGKKVGLAADYSEQWDKPRDENMENTDHRKICSTITWECRCKHST